MATDTNTSKKIDALKCKLIECVVKLAEFKVPSHITVLDKNEITHFGTPNVMQKFEDDIGNENDDEQSDNNSKTWKEALTVASENSIFDQETINEIGLSSYAASLQKLRKMEAPLSVSTFNEIVRFF